MSIVHTVIDRLRLNREPVIALAAALVGTYAGLDPAAVEAALLDNPINAVVLLAVVVAVRSLVVSPATADDRVAEKEAEVQGADAHAHGVSEV